MKLPFKIDGKSYQCPTKWEEVTVKQFQELKQWNQKDFVKLLSILTCVPYDILFNTQTIDIDVKLMPALKFIEVPLNDSTLPPVSHIKIDGKQYPVPKDLGKYTFGQKIVATTKINEALKQYNDAYVVLSQMVAIYMQPIIQEKPYNEDEADKMAAEVIDNCSIVEVFAVGCFFLQKLIGLQRKNSLPYPLNLIKNKWLRGFLNWTYSKKSIRLMRLQAETS